jgi:hypothetical protein
LFANDGERRCSSLHYSPTMAVGATWQRWWVALLGNNGERHYAVKFILFFKKFIR